MADARLALVLLAACGQADAQTGSGAGPTAKPIPGPASWIEIPAMADAAKQALSDPDAVERAQAWGEPAMGCYALSLVYRGNGSATAIAERIIDGLGGVGIVGKDVVAPAAGSGSAAAEGTLTFAFERAAGAAGSGIEGPPSSYRGTLKATLGAGRVALLACFANEREPASCTAACTAFLGGTP